MVHGEERDPDRLRDGERAERPDVPRPAESKRLEELFAKHRGSLEGGAGAREAIEQLRYHALVRP
jgi:hypothetical protein